MRLAKEKKIARSLATAERHEIARSRIIHAYSLLPSLPLLLSLSFCPSFRLPLLVQNRGNYGISAKSMERRTFRAVIVSTSRQGGTGWSVRQNETPTVVG